MRPVFLVLLPSLLLPLVDAGSPPPAMGTETQPELTDAEDDVVYDPLYVGSKDHGYLDTVAAWFAYNDARDTIDLTVKSVDTSDLLTAGEDLQVYCTFAATMTDGVVANADLQFLWNKFGDEDTLRGGVHYGTTRGNNGGSRTLITVNSTFEYVLGAPGYFVWHADRAELQFGGVDIRDPTLVCGEQQNIVMVTQTATNEDRAESQSTFEIAGFRPASVPEKDEMFTTGTVPETRPPVTPTSALGVLVVAVVFGFVAALRRRET